MITNRELQIKTLERDTKRQKLKSNAFKWTGKTTSYSILIFWAMLCLFPFFWAFFASFKSPYLLGFTGLNPFPSKGEWTMANYNSIFHNETLSDYASQWFGNSVMYSTLSAIMNATFNLLGGYALARISMKGKSTIVYYFIVSILVPSQATFVPTYFIMEKLHIISPDISRGAFLLAVTFSGMANIVLTFMARQFFLTQTSEMEEAAKMDGYSALGSFFRITMRKMLPLFATQFVLVFMGSWNTFILFQLFALGDPEKMTINTGIYLLSSSALDKQVGYGQTLAMSNISFAPMLFIYIISLKIQLRGIKGGNK